MSNTTIATTVHPKGSTYSDEVQWVVTGVVVGCILAVVVIVGISVKVRMRKIKDSVEVIEKSDDDYRLSLNNELFSQVSSVNQLKTNRILKEQRTYPQKKIKKSVIEVHRPKTVSFKIDEFYDLDITMFQRRERWSFTEHHRHHEQEVEDGHSPEVRHQTKNRTKLTENADFHENVDFHENANSHRTQESRESNKTPVSELLLTENISFLHRHSNNKAVPKLISSSEPLGPFSLQQPLHSSKTSIYDIPWELTGVGSAIQQANTNIGVDDLVEIRL